MHRMKAHPSQDRLIFLGSLTAVSFVLHGLWEYVQCGPFFVHGSLAPTTAAMLLATLGDLALTGIAYSGTALLMRDAWWAVGRWYVKTWLSIEFFAALLAIATELIGLGFGRWSYSAIAPRLPGTGLSIVPILQLMTLLPVSFGFAAWISHAFAFNDSQRRRS